MCLSIAVHSPDVVLGHGEHLGFAWVVTHNRIGYRCGYVRVPLGHPWYGQEYDDIGADVHGGLTFAEADVACDKGGADDGWWVGFDCCHGGDAPDPTLPGEHRLSAHLYDRPGYKVRTQAYVEAECRSLCEQVKEAATATATQTEDRNR
jgi:hypothetical protein